MSSLDLPRTLLLFVKSINLENMSIIEFLNYYYIILYVTFPQRLVEVHVRLKHILTIIKINKVYFIYTFIGKF